MYQAIAVIELKSIARGIEAADAALKSAGVRLVSSHASCPGKYEIILTGAIADVTAAVAAAVPTDFSADALLLTYGLRKAAPAKAKTLAAKVYGELSTLPIMTVRQALTLLLVCGAAN